jgi:hypothetical protein
MTHLRVARPTDDLDKVSHMYRDGLEFIRQAGHSAGRTIEDPDVTGLSFRMMLNPPGVGPTEGRKGSLPFS